MACSLAAPGAWLRKLSRPAAGALAALDQQHPLPFHGRSIPPQPAQAFSWFALGGTEFITRLNSIMRESMNTGGPVTLTTSTPTTVSALRLELELVAEFPEPRRQALRQPLVPPARLRALRARRHRLHLARRPLPLELHPREQPPRLVRPPLRGEPLRQEQPRRLARPILRLELLPLKRLLHQERARRERFRQAQPRHQTQLEQQGAATEPERPSARPAA